MCGEREQNQRSGHAEAADGRALTDVEVRLSGSDSSLAPFGAVRHEAPLISGIRGFLVWEMGNGEKTSAY